MSDSGTEWPELQLSRAVWAPSLHGKMKGRKSNRPRQPLCQLLKQYSYTILYSPVARSSATHASFKSFCAPANVWYAMISSRPLPFQAARGANAGQGEGTGLKGNSTEDPPHGKEISKEGGIAF